MEIIRAFVERIEVYQAERVCGRKVQRMRIIWNCIGEFMPPHPKENEESAWSDCAKLCRFFRGYKIP